MDHIGLFEGIGGFSLAARMIGWKTRAWCKINPVCQTVLKYHFPEAIPHSDITKTDFTPYAHTIDIITGGFPCQPYSLAGKRKGTDDERHLWPQMLRAIGEVQPGWVVGENVFGLVNWSGGLVFEQVQADLEAQGYQVSAFILPACAKDAPHRRDRIWFVAYNHERNRAKIRFKTGGQKHVYSTETNGFITDSGSTELQNGTQNIIAPDRKKNKTGMDSGFERFSNIGDATNPATIGMEGHRTAGEQKPHPHAEKRIFGSDTTTNPWQNFPTQSPVCSRNDGISTRLDGITFSKHRNESIKAYGNAVVPQIPFEIFKAIEQFNLKFNQNT